MIAFILGCDRTGTHMIAEMLAKHPDVYAGIEQMPEFSYSYAMAFNRDKIDILFPRLCEAYERRIRAAGDKLFIDKCHPNIWIVDQLLERYPNSRIIVTDRGPHATVNSLCNHLTATFDMVVRWRAASIPNGFLGITDYDSYARLNLAGRAFNRWRIHHEFIHKEVMQLCSPFLAQYEEFVNDPITNISALLQYLDLTPVDGLENMIKSERQNAWITELSASAIDIIDGLLERMKGESICIK